ncbi:GlcNAc-PI de-N-acetylase [Enemella evansiae]|uniref:PIG-L deacetylase family protein n=1 Tax=Enemella evansiae TaxID=2016499 RepID=UPI000B96AE71|nr:PIG-L family deacetylase [Enemella evansiae]OYO13162.1 GlcNAc-PI de-N-acetylase [Enemella evansiae]
MTDPLTGARRILFVHAHPDDETLATGALIAHLVGQGVECVLLTATRGEQGEVRPGTFTGPAEDFPAHRERELAGALTALGVTEQLWLGEPPALAPGRKTHRYSDSGMRWVAEGVAGPAEVTGPDALSTVDQDQPLADLVAAVEHVRPDLVISYDDAGGYGHPDHVALHHLCARAAERTGVRLAEVVTPGTEGATVLDLSAELPTVTAALHQHASQVQVDGTEVVHVGGQREPILLRTAVRAC